jgi:hypothetical protein
LEHAFMRHAAIDFKRRTPEAPEGASEGKLASPLHGPQRMSEPRKLRCYEYVDRPYEQVRIALRERARDTLQRATSSAVKRGQGLMASVQAGAAGITVGVNVLVQVKDIREEEAIGGLPPTTTFEIAWQAEQVPALFPTMTAEVSVTPLLSDETQVLLEGEYRPPLGLVGRAADAVALHRVAEASMHHFLREIVEQLRRDLSKRG